MSNKHSKNTLRSRVGGSKKPQRIVVYVEGCNTEPTYIELLKKSNLKVIPVAKSGHGIGSCEEFVNDSQKAFESMSKTEREKYTQRWLMFDYDGRSDFESAIKIAKEKGFSIAFSSMCFEYWFLLHFQNHDGKPIPCKNGSHSQALMDLLNREIQKYNKSLPKNQTKVELYDGSKSMKEDLFELMLAIDPDTHHRRVENACKRSCSIHQAKCAEGAEFKESVTTMHQFLETIGFVSRDKKGEYQLSV